MSNVNQTTGPVLDLSPAIETLLRADFKPLSKIQTDLPDQLMSYVLTGEPATVIDDLPALKGGGIAMELAVAYHERRGKIFRLIKLRDPRFFFRLALVYSRLAHTDFPGEFIYARLGDRDFLDCFLYQLVQGSPCLAPTVREKPKLEAELMAQICGLAGHQPDYVARLAFLANPDSPQTNISEMCQALVGFADYCAHHPAPIREALTAGNQAQPIFALKILNQHKVNVSNVLPEIIGLALKGGKKVRELAVTVLQSAKSETEAWLNTHFAGQKTAEQLQSLKLLVDLLGPEAHPILLKWKEQAKDDKISAQIGEYLGVCQPVAEAQLPTFPPLPPVATDVPLPAELEKILVEILPYANKEVKRPKPEALSEALAKGTVGTLEKTSLWPGEWEKFNAVLKKFVTHPQVQLIHVIRLMVMTDYISCRYRDTEELFYPEGPGAVLLDLYRQSHSPAFDLRQLAAVIKAVGVAPNRVGGTIIHAEGGWNRYDIFRYEPEAVWPYFAENLDLLQDVFSPKKVLSGYGVEQDQACRRRNALQVLQIFPNPPQALIPVLWETALGTSKTERPLAQPCLESLPGSFERIVSALEDKNLATRQAAVEWLAKLNRPEAIEPLKTLLRKEKSEAGRGLLLTALEKLGASVDEFLNRDGLMAEATDGLKKGVPDVLSWFPFAQLPAVHWADTGERVDSKIVTWWLVQANKQGTPEPGPILRRYAGLIPPTERQALGQFILDAWIAQDTVPAYTPEALEKEVERYGKYLLTSRWTQAQVDSYLPEYRRELAKQFKGSALKERGILAVAAACVGQSAAPVVKRFLNTFHGNRLAQCKALVQLLAWVDDTASVQLLLSVSGRFRVKTIREEAALQVQALADRKGWTVDELADRTVPTAGFEDGPELTLDFGSQQFTLRIDQSLQLVLTDAGGKILKALPDPKKDDSEELAKEAKKIYSDAKKQLKTILESQQARLYEAMCTQRSWRADEWNAFLNQHPVLGRCCQRLVWALYDGEALVTTFRPLEDGTLTDCQDESVVPDPAHHVRLAHRVTIGDELARQWQQHLADYEIQPLFPQFDKPPVLLSSEQTTSKTWTSCDGYVIKASKLRTKAEKSGYARGAADFERTYTEYFRRFRALECEVVIEFDGITSEISGVTFEDHDVTLAGLSFRRRREHERTGTRMDLKDVPSVLLCEAVADYQAIGAMGKKSVPPA